MPEPGRLDGRRLHLPDGGPDRRRAGRRQPDRPRPRAGYRVSAETVVKSASAATLAVPGRYQAHVSGAGHSGLMLKTHIRRIAAGAMISAALTVGSLGLTATTASARAC